MAGLKLLIRSILLAALFGSAAGLVWPESTGAQTVVSKRCSRCGSFVSNNAQAGTHCPYCSAFWVDEKYEYTPGGGYSVARRAVGTRFDCLEPRVHCA